MNFLIFYLFVRGFCLDFLVVVVVLGGGGFWGFLVVVFVWVFLVRKNPVK